MTVKQFYDAWDFEAMEDGFSIKLGEKQSVLIYEGDEAVTAMRMIAEARTHYPILNGVTDEEVLKIMVGVSLAKEVAV